MRKIEEHPKNILITGPPRCGKSTLIEKLVHRAKGPTTGFFSREIRKQGRRTGFSINTLDGKEEVLAHEKHNSRHRVGKYGVSIQDIDDIAVPSIRPAKSHEVIIIDEIGKMECYSPLFKKALIEALDCPTPVIGTIALKGSKFIQNIKARENVLLIHLNEQNRNDPELFSQLLSVLSGK